MRISNPSVQQLVQARDEMVKAGILIPNSRGQLTYEKTAGEPRRFAVDRGENPRRMMLPILDRVRALCAKGVGGDPFIVSNAMLKVSEDEYYKILRDIEQVIAPYVKEGREVVENSSQTNLVELCFAATTVFKVPQKK